MAILHVGYNKAKRPILGRNLKVPKSQQKDSRNTYKLFYAEKRLEKNAYYSKNDKILKSGKNGHIAWAIVRQNGLVWDGI